MFKKKRFAMIALMVCSLLFFQSLAVFAETSQADENDFAVNMVDLSGDTDNMDTVDEGPISAVIDGVLPDDDDITGENELVAEEELGDEDYQDNYRMSRARAAAGESYLVSFANTNGSFSNVGTFSTFADAKKAMNQKSSAESDWLKKNSYVVRTNKGRVVAMVSGMAIATPSSATLVFQNKIGGRKAYVAKRTTMYYYESETMNKIKVGVAGTVNYTSYESLLLVPTPFLGEYATGAMAGRYYRDYYTANKDGDLVHNVSTFVDDNTATHYEAGEKTSFAGFAFDKAPSFMQQGVKYYSMDGINYYSDQQLTKKVGTHYAYFQYLSYRTQTSYNASDLNRYFDNNYTSGVLKNNGKAFVDAQNKYGVNALLEIAFASHESAGGTSSFAKDRYNLFGINAGDAKPSDASYYSSVTACVNYHAGIMMSQKYFDAKTDSRYFGTHAGNKNLGVAVSYASDPYHGEKIAGWAYRIDKYLGYKDYGKETIGISGESTPVYASANTSSILYKLMNNASKTSLTGLPVVINGTSGGYYKVQSDMPIVNGTARFDGTYSYNHVGYVDQKHISIVRGEVDGGNSSSSSSRPESSSSSSSKPEGSSSSSSKPESSSSSSSKPEGSSSSSSKPESSSSSSSKPEGSSSSSSKPEGSSSSSSKPESSSSSSSKPEGSSSSSSKPEGSSSSSSKPEGSSSSSSKPEGSSSSSSKPEGSSSSSSKPEGSSSSSSKSEGSSSSSSKPESSSSEGTPIESSSSSENLSSVSDSSGIESTSQSEVGGTSEYNADGIQVDTPEPIADKPDMEVVDYDSATKIKLLAEESVLPEDAYLEVSEIPGSKKEETHDLLNKLYDNSVTDIVLFDITAKVGDQVVQPDGTVTIMIPLSAVDKIKPDELNIKVFHISDDGEVEDMNATVVGSNIVFQTTHFSYYAVAEYKDDKQATMQLLAGNENTLTPVSPGTNDISVIVLVSLLVMIVFAGLLAVQIHRSKAKK